MSCFKPFLSLTRTCVVFKVCTLSATGDGGRVELRKGLLESVEVNDDDDDDDADDLVDDRLRPYPSDELLVGARGL